MAHYYFDLRDGGGLLIDEEGAELRDMQIVQMEAARALAGFAWGHVARFNGGASHQLATTVRDEHGPVMEVKFSVEIIRKQ